MFLILHTFHPALFCMWSQNAKCVQWVHYRKLVSNLFYSNKSIDQTSKNKIFSDNIPLETFKFTWGTNVSWHFWNAKYFLNEVMEHAIQFEKSCSLIMLLKRQTPSLRCSTVTIWSRLHILCHDEILLRLIILSEFAQFMAQQEFMNLYIYIYICIYIHVHIYIYMYIFVYT